jgi:haloalkane dehalogenase
MHYVDVGEGDTILFLHGSPTSSYLWRNIIPHLSGQARCIAVDLIGMGQSDHPDIPYRYDDHYRYLTGFIDALDIGSNLTLVIHDWGSALGFRWAHDHPEDVRAIAFMEGMIRGLSLDDMPGSLRMAMRMMRWPGTGWLMISAGNIFMKKLLPDLTYAEISPDALAYYRSAFPTTASRRALRQWPREVPLDGTPEDNTAVVEAYREWLTHTDIPKLLFYGNAGVAIKEPEVAWCRRELSNIEIVDLGDAIHFVQETHPDTIGTELARWYGKL